MVQIRTLQEQIILYRAKPDGVVYKAEQTLRLSMTEYQVNKVDFQQLIGNWNDWLMFRIQLARLEANLAGTLASLERVIGCQLATIPEEDSGAIKRPNSQ